MGRGGWPGWIFLITSGSRKQASRHVGSKYCRNDSQGQSPGPKALPHGPEYGESSIAKGQSCRDGMHLYGDGLRGVQAGRAMDHGCCALHGLLACLPWTKASSADQCLDTDTASLAAVQMTCAGVHDARGWRQSQQTVYTLHSTSTLCEYYTLLVLPLVRVASRRQASPAQHAKLLWPGKPHDPCHGQPSPPNPHAIHAMPCLPCCHALAPPPLCLSTFAPWPCKRPFCHNRHLDTWRWWRWWR